MEFKKIQLNGFKSFAEKADFLIEDGLTGIVGPNGCGKSNIVESLRWAMGETSAKSMRGSGMEDVIFSGTSNKASKNIAEVTIEVENKDKEGPVQYRDHDQIQIKRKIEKDKGSKFYINGKEVRARPIASADAALLTRRAASIIALDGTQPVLRQSPPINPPSIKTTFAPICTAPAATESPAEPAPITTKSASNFIRVPLIEENGQRRQHRQSQ